MECALTSPRFGARAAPGLGEGRLGVLRRPRLRRRGRGGAPGAAIHWLARLAPPLGERPEAWASVPNRPGRGSRDPEVSAARKLLTNRTCLTRPSRLCSRVPTTLSWAPPLLDLDAPRRLLCPRRPRVLPRVWASCWRPAWRAGPVASSLLSPPFFFFVRSRVAFPSTALPDSLLFVCIRPRSTTAQSVAFVYRVLFLTRVRGSLM